MLVLDHEDDLAVIMDFAVFECRIEGETVFDRYRSQAKKITAMEEEILAACDNAFSSLFQLHATAPAEGTLVMQDLLDMRGEVILTDLASSATSVPGLLFFARILPFPQFNMTSCMSSWKRVQPSRPRDSAQNLPQRSTHACGTATHSMP
jgi:hypothetical protein